MPIKRGSQQAAPVVPAAQTHSPAALVVPPSTMAAAREEGLHLAHPLKLAVVQLDVVDAASYEAADELLGRILKARKTWGERMERIIRPIRQGLDELYALNREVDRPLLNVETILKNKMKAFKVEELKQLAAAAEEKRLAEERLRQEAEAKALAAQRASTPQMRGKLQAQSYKAAEAAAEVAQQEAPAPTTGLHSSTRVPKKVRIIAWGDFIQGIAKGLIPDDIVAVVDKKLTAYYKEDPESVKLWPGVEEYDDVQIVGR